MHCICVSDTSYNPPTNRKIKPPKANINSEEQLTLKLMAVCAWPLYPSTCSHGTSVDGSDNDEMANI